MDYQRDTNIRFFDLNGIHIESPELSVIKSRLSDALKNRGGFHQIITFNTDFLRLTYLDEQFKLICKNSFMVVPDGIGITLLMRIKHGRKMERITGSNLFELCLDLADIQALRVALIGSAESTLEKLYNLIKNKWPNVVIKYLSPQMNFEKSPTTNESIVEDIRKFRPDILMAALGCPRQEKWIYSNKNLIGAKINIGVGGVFDLFSGTKKRAPEFIQKLGLEWMWRLMHEPKRLSRRYLLHDLPFFIKTFVRVLLKLET